MKVDRRALGHVERRMRRRNPRQNRHRGADDGDDPHGPVQLPDGFVELGAHATVHGIDDDLVLEIALGVAGPGFATAFLGDAISRTNVKPERFRDHATFEIADSGVSFSVSVGVLAGTKWTISISIVRPNPGTHRTFIPLQVRSAAYCTFHIRRH